MAKKLTRPGLGSKTMRLIGIIGPGVVYEGAGTTVTFGFLRAPRSRYISRGEALVSDRISYKALRQCPRAFRRVYSVESRPAAVSIHPASSLGTKVGSQIPSKKFRTRDVSLNSRLLWYIRYKLSGSDEEPQITQSQVRLLLRCFNFCALLE